MYKKTVMLAKAFRENTTLITGWIACAMLLSVWICWIFIPPSQFLIVPLGNHTRTEVPKSGTREFHDRVEIMESSTWEDTSVKQVEKQSLKTEKNDQEIQMDSKKFSAAWSTIVIYDSKSKDLWLSFVKSVKNGLEKFEKNSTSLIDINSPDGKKILSENGLDEKLLPIVIFPKNINDIANVTNYDILQAGVLVELKMAGTGIKYKSLKTNVD